MSNMSEGNFDKLEYLQHGYAQELTYLVKNYAAVALYRVKHGKVAEKSCET